MTASLTILTLLTLVQAVPPPEPKDNARPVSPVESFQPDPKWKSLGNDVWFDPALKRLVVRGRICLTDGALEHLLCSKGTKEHESILSTEAAPKIIHAGLLLTGATPGHPVRFEPKFEPPTGSEIAINVEWEQAGRKKKADARAWVKDGASGAQLSRDWVFAGSELFPDRRTKQMIYAADDGDLITVANFSSSILDLPYRSSSSDVERSYVVNTEQVPPRGTTVIIFLTPQIATPTNPPR